ncbi:Uncharacterized conserved protein YecE, DUF72 family [Dyella jiangningensis]|uniref:DUF72 domain-containing protein n=1 Tax=Dyella sp. AtDHG13 TaxID=1938897 RepID=UPI00089055FC|nr:DUF72 domain-containing protein [Dyella sp. AtDHG13]PXV59621.1 uncharacterized protein YecE (DUF72 family) [Dyella sp. AtDHG13]SDJ29649.1 Uncharacterized conserved protein YecE, DUF72 family [Dyella jiangningensis]
MAMLCIGISGWHYDTWRGVFYPEDLPVDGELGYAARQFRSIELNASFYRLQRPEDYRAWYRSTPAGFVFAVKAPRFLTHVKRLKDLAQPFSVFLCSGPLELREKLGPFLWQLPPNFHFERDRIETFFAGLPRRGEDACALARQHARTPCPKNFARKRLRHALEVRHPSFLDEDFIRLARVYGVAVVVSDGAGRWPMLQDVTAGFMYVRLHGEQSLYSSRYDDASLARWARRIRSWLRGGTSAKRDLVVRDGMPVRRSRDVYVYFDNDAHVDAPFDALRLADRLRRSLPS